MGVAGVEVLLRQVDGLGGGGLRGVVQLRAEAAAGGGRRVGGGGALAPESGTRCRTHTHTHTHTQADAAALLSCQSLPLRCLPVKLSATTARQAGRAGAAAPTYPSTCACMHVMMRARTAQAPGMGTNVHRPVAHQDLPIYECIGIRVHVTCRLLLLQRRRRRRRRLRTSAKITSGLRESALADPPTMSTWREEGRGRREGRAGAGRPGPASALP